MLGGWPKIASEIAEKLVRPDDDLAGTASAGIFDDCPSGIAGLLTVDDRANRRTLADGFDGARQQLLAAAQLGGIGLIDRPVPADFDYVQDDEVTLAPAGPLGGQPNQLAIACFALNGDQGVATGTGGQLARSSLTAWRMADSSSTAMSPFSLSVWRERSRPNPSRISP